MKNGQRKNGQRENGQRENGQREKRIGAAPFTFPIFRREA